MILEAGASGLPVIAIAEGGPAALVENRHTGLLCRPDADHVAGSLLQLAASPELRDEARLGRRAQRPRALLGALAEPARGRLPAGAGRRRGRDPDRGAAARDRNRSAWSPERTRRQALQEYDVPLLESVANLDDPDLYFNRELSWLEFNRRVLELAEDTEVPLLERLRFCAIYASNLDEFYMVRVAGLFDQMEAGIDARGPDGLRAERTDRSHPAPRSAARQATAAPASAASCARRWRARASASSRSTTRARRSGARSIGRFHEQVFAALTPLVIGLGRPFPYISNLSLSLAVLLRDPESGGRDRRPGEGAEGAARALPAGRRGGDLRAARAGDRRQPRPPLPGHRGRRLRLLPGHPRRRLQGQRRGRRPSAGGPGRAPPTALRRGRAAGDRRRDEREAARTS